MAEARMGEKYLCAVCGYAGDSDTVGAHNIFIRTCGSVGSLESPMLQKKAG
jgi:transposase